MSWRQSEHRVFADRREAGQVLARALEHFRNDPNAIVLALPRGGVPVAYEVARELNLPLDVFIVRKLGVPVHPELAMGAIASGGGRVLNDDVIRRLGIPSGDVEDVTESELRELQRREDQYRGGRPPPSLHGRAVIVVDDGLATGASMRAAIEALKHHAPARVVIAVPVGAADTCRALTPLVDELVCARTPDRFDAVGRWYADFRQTTDEEVCALLDSLHASATAPLSGR